ncbi:FHA domain-containing protein [Microbacterium sp. W1N]|uniref:FHA domain-containing protein FhaB/FipA n=1 Tax=Microbacterium festucae TaxID=2977531 RepID=UPI0021C004E8|nr:FHA domain-containing protein [Microbacterium festucae]MCT9819444.1 FHA domain-containing protein [Microbacterium festucae]
MSELTLLLLQVGFLVLLWFFVFAVVYSLRADLFGVKARKLPEPATAAPAAAAPSPSAPTAPVAPAAPRSASGPVKATTDAVSRIVVTSGPKAGLELPLGSEPVTIGRSSESGLVIRDDYTSSHHARLLLWGTQWMVQDLDSTNGTWHDGKRVSAPVPITVGAPIKVGATTFELRK